MTDSPITDSQSETSFEDALRQLEQIVQRLESGDVPLDQSIALFEEGSRLRGLCQARLDAAKARIEKIASTEQGVPVATTAFDQD